MKPNIVFLVMDTARAQNLSCYGHERETTPFLDKLAEKGFKADNAYANSPWTLPSHYSFFTGDLPSEHGKDSMESFGGVKKDTLPERLTEKGYRTIGVSNNPYISSIYGFEDIFDDFYFNADEDLLFENDELLDEVRRKSREGEWSSQREKYKYFFLRSLKEAKFKSLLNGIYYKLKNKAGDERWGDSGAEFAHEKVKRSDIDSEEPFFLFVNYVEPHAPYTPPESYARKFIDVELEEAWQIGSKNPLYNLGKEDEEEAELMEALYDAELLYLDSKIKELYNYIKDETSRETVYVIVGDHGEFFGEDCLWGHQGDLRPQVLNVPLIVEGLSDEEDIEDVVSLTELYGYINGVADGEAPDLGQGTSIAQYKGIYSHTESSVDIPEKYDRNLISLKENNGFAVASEEGVHYNQGQESVVDGAVGLISKYKNFLSSGSEDIEYIDF